MNQSTNQGRSYSEPDDVRERLLAATINPRDRAFISTLGKTAVCICEAVQPNVSDIDFKRATLTIVHLKERVKLKCSNCGELLVRWHLFCPWCGNKVDQAMREKVEQRRPVVTGGWLRWVKLRLSKGC